MRIGIDLGGTKIEAVALASDGRELFRRRVETPHLEITYRPIDCPFATDPVPKVIKRP